MAKQELNNLTPGSTKEQPEQGTGLEEEKKVTLPEKFKSTEELVKAYNELEKKSTKDNTEFGRQGERLAKLEGILETQEKAEEKIAGQTLPPQITAEERKAMEKRFRDDFQKDAIGTLHNFNRPYMEDARLANERATKLEGELATEKSKREEREMKELAAKARGTGETAKLFDEMTPKIQEELKKNKAWGGFENPPEAVFYHLLGKSTKTLARADDEGRESFVEGSSPVTEESKSNEALKKKMIQKIASTKGVSHLP
ncbi:MAG TPA: hypothetical protein ENI23_03845 [bacterium]|nr:hypothetical protein [bacterium]